MANRLKTGDIGLVQQTEDGRIIQIGLRTKQRKMLEAFLAEISQGSPLVQMGEEHDLVLKNKDQ
jgi:hypothetical protein